MTDAFAQSHRSFNCLYCKKPFILEYPHLYLGTEEDVKKRDESDDWLDYISKN